MISNLRSEIHALEGNTKGIFFLCIFRISAYFSKNRILRLIGFPIRFFYTLIVQWFMGIDIHDSTKIGRGFNVFHGQGLVISSSVIIGDYVIVRQNTTIGNAKAGGGSPTIGNNVQIGANSVIIGEIKIGANSIIAAGSVVVKDVPSNVLVAGNPAKIVKHL
jgi:putative colanic acid biosynthesis acetyltransferase WcaB